MKRIIKKYFILIIAIIEVIFLTGIYYYFWRIGYTHGIEGYPEYLGLGKYILMGVYIFLVLILLYFAGAFRYRRLKVGNIVVRQWGVVLMVNTITLMQLSLTAKHLVAKRPMFDATVVQFVFVIIYCLLVDFIIKHYSIAGKMLVIGRGLGEAYISCYNERDKDIPSETQDRLAIGDSFDGYRIAEIETRKYSLVDISDLFEKVRNYSAVLLREQDETTEIVIRHCLEERKTVYIAKENPTIYGVNRIYDNGINYILVFGLGEQGGSIFDKMRTYLI